MGYILRHCLTGFIDASDVGPFFTSSEQIETGLVQFMNAVKPHYAHTKVLN